MERLSHLVLVALAVGVLAGCARGEGLEGDTGRHDVVAEESADGIHDGLPDGPRDTGPEPAWDTPADPIADPGVDPSDPGTDPGPADAVDLVDLDVHADPDADPGSDPGVDGWPCPPDPTLVGPCPSVCTGGCTTGVCVVDCNRTSACQSDHIVCPDELPCHVQCGGLSACQRATIDCSDLASCTIECSATSTCQSGTLNCGAHACRSACSGSSSSLVVVCGTSCDCTTTC